MTTAATTITVSETQKIRPLYLLRTITIAATTDDELFAILDYMRDTDDVFAVAYGDAARSLKVTLRKLAWVVEVNGVVLMATKYATVEAAMAALVGGSEPPPSSAAKASGSLSAFAARQHAARAYELSNLAKSLTWHANNDRDIVNPQRKHLHAQATSAKAEARTLRGKVAWLQANS